MISPQIFQQQAEIIQRLCPHVASTCTHLSSTCMCERQWLPCSHHSSKSYHPINHTIREKTKVTIFLTLYRQLKVQNPLSNVTLQANEATIQECYHETRKSHGQQRWHQKSISVKNNTGFQNNVCLHLYWITWNQDSNEIPFGKCWRSDYSGVPGVYHYEHPFNVNQAQ